MLFYTRVVFFFFSSRRRHTRFDCDWSSDVCSSDLRQTSGGGPCSSSDRHVCTPASHATSSAATRHKGGWGRLATRRRSEEHTSELQSQSNLVCRLLLEKKKINHMTHTEDTSFANSV